MGSQQVFQPLSRKDKITVVLYRAGIVMSTIIISCLAFLLRTASSNSGRAFSSPLADILAYVLYASVGMSVFFIHLYVGKFKRFLLNLYFIGLGCLAVLFYLGNGSVSTALVITSYNPLLLLPLSGCLGFVTAKEAFCFQLVEGYLLAVIMPACLLLVSGGFLTYAGASYGLVLVAVMLVIFTLRKITMPIAYDIGDKTAYREN
jgi:uncharacterized integral membrane protein